jgi:hypothetical protein
MAKSILTKTVFQDKEYQKVFKYAYEHFDNVTPWFFGENPEPFGFKVHGPASFMVQFSGNETKYWIYSGTTNQADKWRVLTTDFMIKYMDFKLTELAFISSIEG